MPTVTLTHHPLVLISSSGARRRFWSLCGLVDWTQRQASRRGWHPPMNWEGSWGGEMDEKWKTQRGNNKGLSGELNTVQPNQMRTASESESHKSRSNKSMNYTSGSFIQLRLRSQPFRVLVDWLQHCHVLFIWFQWSDCSTRCYICNLDHSERSAQRLVKKRSSEEAQFTDSGGWGWG